MNVIKETTQPEITKLFGQLTDLKQEFSDKEITTLNTKTLKKIGPNVELQATEGLEFVQNCLPNISDALATITVTKKQLEDRRWNLEKIKTPFDSFVNKEFKPAAESKGVWNTLFGSSTPPAVTTTPTPEGSNDASPAESTSRNLAIV